MQQTSKLRKLAILLVGIAASAVFLWLALRQAEFAQIGEALAGADLFWSLPFLGALFAFYFLKSVRWAVLLTPMRATTGGQMFPAVMMGYAATSVLPMQLGELIRSYVASRNLSLAYASVLTTIGIERIFDLLTILTLVAVVSIATPDLPPIFTTAGIVIVAVCALGIVVSVLMVHHSDTFLRLARWVSSLLPNRLQEWLMRQLEHVAQGFVSISSVSAVVTVAINSLIQWTLMGACLYFSLIALGISLPVSGVALLLLATVIGISLPTSPGYIGNIQFAFTVALTPYGVDPSLAVAASIYYHVIAYVAVVVVGFAYFFTTGYTLSDIDVGLEPLDDGKR